MPVLFALLCINTVQAQSRISSPYSRFGIGELFSNTHVNNMAMGGISQAVYSPYFVNVANPASYSAFDSLAFIFDVSLHARYTQLSTTTISQTADYASIGNLLFGFPISRKIKASFGLLPYSATGYKMADTRFDSTFKDYQNIYDGSGGINQFYIGGSYAISKTLSAGINVSYLFGTMDHQSATIYPASINWSNIKQVNSTRVHDFLLNYGLMYRKVQENGFHYNAGLSFTVETDVNTTDKRLSYTYSINSLGVDIPRDTIIDDPAVKGSITLPTQINGGFSMGSGNKWLLGADVSWKQWENFQYTGRTDSLLNNLQFGIGGFYNPTTSTVSTYWQRITYRAGVRYSNGFLELRNNRIDEFGITFGVGLPLPRTSSTINLAVEVGSRGTQKENLINENFVKFTLGLSIFERWFIIRKYE